MLLKPHIRDPHFDKNYMVAFESETDSETWAYNVACLHVMRQHALNPFHQVGDRDEPGYHAWEIWTRSNREAMEKLLPEVEEEAQRLLTEW